MRVFASLHVVVSLVLTVNTGEIDYLTLHPADCVADVNELVTRLDALKVTTFQEDKSTTSSGSTTTSSPAITSENAKHYDKLQADSTSVVDSLKTARGSCCGLDIERDDEESRKTIFGAFESYSTATIKVYKTLNSTVTAFDKNGKSFAVAQGVIMDVRKIIVDSFNVCLVVDVPKMNYEKAKKDAEEILETMENGRETFGIPFPIDEILVE